MVLAQRKVIVLLGAATTMVAAAGIAAAVASKAAAPPSLPSVPAPGISLTGQNTVLPLNITTAIELSAVNGTLDRVHVQDATGTVVTEGKLTGPDRWTSQEPLPPSQIYKLVAELRDGNAQPVIKQTTLVTQAPAAELTAAVAPLDDETVGVGMPIMVTFNKPIADRAAMQKRFAVKDARAVTGAWHWFSDTEVHYRPKEYWPARYDVSVSLNLKGYHNGDGVWGMADRQRTFTTSDRVVSTVDVSTYTMTVTRNGQTLRTFPISGGRPKYPTHNGTHIVLEKFANKVMDSSTVGITGADAYLTKVKWATRITNSGTFVHGAPWSVASQGRRNVSHGCINASDANAQFFYDISHRGDIVIVKGSNKGPRMWDGGVRNWSMSWQDWKAGSALPVLETPADADPQLETAAPGASSTPAASPSPSAASSSTPAVRSS